MERVIATTARLGIAGLIWAISLTKSGFAEERQDCRGGNPPELAIAACTKLLESAGGSGRARAELLLDRGNAKFRQRKYEEALGDFDEALRADDRYGLAYNNRGRTHLLRKDFDRALADFDRALALLPNFATAYHNRGQVHVARGESDKAIADFGEAIKRDSKNPEYFASRAAVHEGKGSADAALQDYGAALALNKNNVRWLFARAKILRQKKEFARALADVDAVIALDAKNKEAADLKAELRIAASPADVATCIDEKKAFGVRLVACRRVIDTKQGEPQDQALAYIVRANDFANKFDYEKAIADMTDAIRIRPVAAAYNDRGIIYNNMGETRRAVADYDEALRLDPKYVFALNNRGNVYLQIGDLDRAIADYNTALTLSKFANAHNNRARALRMKGEFEAALADLKEAIQLSPKSNLAPLVRCAVHNDMKQFDLAIEQCNASMKAAGAEYTEALQRRGDAWREKGDLVQALADYDNALDRNPNWILAYVGRAQLFEKRNEPVRARADYRSAAFAITRLDDVETTRARNFARQRLDVLSKAQGPVTPGRRIALIVGNNAYKNVAPLESPVRDATMIAQTLRGVGFDAVTVSNDVGRNKFLETLRAFALEAEKADWAVIYFAGHGLEIGGVNYLVPVDANLKIDSAAAGEAVALEQVIAAVQGARKLKLVMLDACRDNPFVPKMQRTIALKLVNKGLSNIEPDAGFMVVYGAKHGETALDGDGKNSPFATAIAQNMKTPGIEMRKLFDIVRDDVLAATKKQQQPFAYGSLPGREDFYFVAAK